MFLEIFYREKVPERFAILRGRHAKGALADNLARKGID
jgi:hypothetical protein